MSRAAPESVANVVASGRISRQGHGSPSRSPGHGTHTHTPFTHTLTPGGSFERTRALLMDAEQGRACMLH